MKPYYILDPTDIKKEGDEYFHNRGWQPIATVGGKVLNDCVRRPMSPRFEKQILARGRKVSYRRKITVFK